MPEMTETELMEQLKAEFPKEATQVKDIGGFKQIGVKPQYIIQRLNECFGVLGWEHEIVKDPNGNLMCNDYRVKYSDKSGNEHEKHEVMCYGELRIYRINEDQTKTLIHVIRTHGGSQVTSGNLADAYKGAKTDSLGKCASYLEIAHEAYKGEMEDPRDDNDTPPKTTSKPTETKTKSKVDEKKEKVIQELTKIRKLNDLAKEEIQQIAQETFNKVETVDIKKLSVPQLEKLLNAIQKKYSS